MTHGPFDATMVELEDNLKWMQSRGCNSVDAELVDAETRGYNSMDG